MMRWSWMHWTAIGLALVLSTSLSLSCRPRPWKWRGAPPDIACPASSDDARRCVGGGKVWWCVWTWDNDAISCAPLEGSK